MKKIKFPLVVSAFIIAVFCGLAFTPAPVKVMSTQGTTQYYFELVSSGNKLDRTDWVISQQDADCPEEHTSNPCRILAENTGSNPSVAAFNNILSNSSNFSTSYPMYVTYFP